MKFPAHKILVIVTRQIGDVLLTTPLLRSLRRAYPHALLDVLVYKGTESILNGNPDVNALIAASEHPTLKETLRLARKIFRRYDLAISTLCGDRPLIYTLQAASKRVSIVPPYRLMDTWKRIISHGWTELDNWDTHTLIQNLRLCDVLGIDRYYDVVVPESPDSEERLNHMLPFPFREQAYAVFHMVPLRRYKQWTLTGWTRLAQHLISEGFFVVVTGGGDREEIDYIRSAMTHIPEGIVSLAGGLKFSEVALLLRMSKVYIGPDTAVTHLAAATGTPTVALYGPTNPVKWAPWPHGYAQDKNPFERKGTQLVGNVFLIQGQGPGDCVPCHLEGCERHRESKSLCLEELSAETVIHGVKTVIEASPRREMIPENHKIKKEEVMETRVILLCSEGVARDKYQETLRNLGVQLDTVSSLTELYDAMVQRPYNGVLIDIITKIKTSQDEKVLIHAVLEEFPLVQLKWEADSGVIKSIFLGQVKSSGTLEDFINQECRRFHARKIRSSIRKDIHLNVILARDRHFHEDGVEHTVTINLSKGGCFLFSVDKWERGDQAWFIMNDLKDHTPIQGTVKWQIEWGKSMKVPGIGIEFQDIRDAQLREFSDKYCD